MVGLYSIMVSAPDCGSGDLSSILDKDIVQFYRFLWLLLRLDRAANRSLLLLATSRLQPWRPAFQQLNQQQMRSGGETLHFL